MNDDPGLTEPGERPSRRPIRTTDVKCLECGALNIPDNHICGACGANLPVIYDQEGRLFHWETDSPYWDALHPEERKKRQGSWALAPLIFRVVLVFIGILFAMWMMARRLNPQ
jgi:hypothetical protein